MSGAMTCPGCGSEVEAIAIEDVDVATVIFFGQEPGAWVSDARELRFGDVAILHHNCSHPQIGGSSAEREREWWACEEPERMPDEAMRYELNCANCARRWTREQVD